jgi:DnaJ-domain-containing protein 1
MAAVVLCVSSSSATRALIGSLLDPDQHRVVVVDSLTGALARAGMPGLEAILLQADIVRACPDAVERLRAAVAGPIAVVLIDRAYGDEARGATERRSYGADAFVALPPDREDLERAIRAPREGVREAAGAVASPDSGPSLDGTEQITRFAQHLFGKLDELDAYQLLRVSPSAEQTQIEAAFRKRALELHPDRHGHAVDDETRERLYQIFMRISWAYRRIGDPASRREYDRGRAPRSSSD